MTLISKERFTALGQQLVELLAKHNGSIRLGFAYRPAMAAPSLAEGSHKTHVVAQTLVIRTALGL